MPRNSLTAPDPRFLQRWTTRLATACAFQLASTASVVLAFPTAGACSSGFVIPNDPVFANVPLFHQFVQVELDAQLSLASLSSSNGLLLTVGSC